MKGIRVNCRTGEIKTIDDGLPEQVEKVTLQKGLDIEKLKTVLVESGVIKNKNEIE